MYFPFFTFINGLPQPLLDDKDVIIVDDQIPTQILNLPPVLRNQVGLVGREGDGFHASEDAVFGRHPVGAVPAHLGRLGRLLNRSRHLLKSRLKK